MFRNISLYPVCAEDEDCIDITERSGEEHRCFMYMCFPWNNNQGPFRSCKRRSTCVQLSESEGGDGGDGECYRHHSRRNVLKGICVQKEEMKHCESHEDCPADLRCVNRFCGENIYFQALHFNCDHDGYCKVPAGRMTCRRLFCVLISICLRTFCSVTSAATTSARLEKE